jgi:hypothetical protein
MPFSWNEIRSRAIEFSKEWKNETSEDAEAKSFWDAFFEVFGVPRCRVASFEKPVKRPDGTEGYIDLLWKGTLLVEHKSRGVLRIAKIKEKCGFVPTDRMQRREQMVPQLGRRDDREVKVCVGHYCRRQCQTPTAVATAHAPKSMIPPESGMSETPFSGFASQK